MAHEVERVSEEKPHEAPPVLPRESTLTAGLLMLPTLVVAFSFTSVVPATDTGASSSASPAVSSVVCLHSARRIAQLDRRRQAADLSAQRVRLGRQATVRSTQSLLTSRGWAFFVCDRKKRVPLWFCYRVEIVGPAWKVKTLGRKAFPAYTREGETPELVSIEPGTRGSPGLSRSTSSLVVFYVLWWQTFPVF